MTELSSKEILERFATINNITTEEAEKQLGSPATVEEMLDSIKQLNINKMREQHPLNRAQRRAMAKKMGKKGREKTNIISNTAEKLNYIDLIQKLRKLNEKKENENYEEASENNERVLS